MKTSETSLFRLLVLSSSVVFALIAIIVFLSVNDRRVSRIEYDTNNVVVPAGSIVCDERCPPVLERIPGVNIYKTKGSIQFRDLTIRYTSDTTFQLIQNGSVFGLVGNNGVVFGNLTRPAIPNKILIAGMSPGSQPVNDFVKINTEITYQGLDESQILLQTVTELRSPQREGVRITVDETVFTFFTVPQPQVIFGIVSSAQVSFNLYATFISPETASSLGAYPCVQGPFAYSIPTIVIDFHFQPSTCLSEIQSRVSRKTLSLASNLNCFSATLFPEIAIGLTNTSIYPLVCFGKNACHQNMFPTIITGEQRSLDMTLIGPTPILVALGCKSIESDNLQINVRCMRSQI